MSDELGEVIERQSDRICAIEAEISVALYHLAKARASVAGHLFGCGLDDIRKVEDILLAVLPAGLRWR